MADFYDRPVPGESLTVAPGNRPYERPPVMSKLSEVLDFYIERITKEEVIDNTIEMLDIGIPVELIVETITIFFVMNGTHSIQNRLLISPVLHEYVRMLGKQAGIKVVDGLNPSDETPENRNHLAEKLRIEIDKLEGTEEDDEGVDLMRKTMDMLESESPTDDLEQTMPMMDKMPIVEDKELLPKEIEQEEQLELDMMNADPSDKESLSKMINEQSEEIKDPMQMGLMSRR